MSFIRRALVVKTSTPWWVVLALVWTSLAPNLAQAVVSQSGRAGFEVCTSTGLLLVVSPESANVHADTPVCDWATHMGGLSSLLPGNASLSLPFAGVYDWQGLAVNTRAPGVTWTLFHSRAPPFAL